MITVVRTLCATECTRSFIHITSEMREPFKGIESAFFIVIGDDEYPVHLDRQHRIWSSKFKTLLNFNVGSRVKLTKVNTNRFTVKMIK